jgi:D-alanyl-D-alanine dipeptidase
VIIQLCVFSATPLSLYAQTAAAPAQQIEPGPKPADAPLTWKQLVGVYEYSSYKGPKQTMILLEKEGRLLMQPKDGPTRSEEIHEGDGKVLITDPDGRTYIYDEHREASGIVKSFSYLVEFFVRADAGATPAQFYHVTPARPVAELRAEALRASPPQEKGPFRKPDLIEIITLDPGFHLDIRYAQANNFLSTPVYSQARAFMQRPAAEALLRVLHKLQPLGYGLLIHDAYRPWYVTKIFWDATPPEGHIFVADPAKGSKHNRGCAVDITLYDLSTGQPIEMTGLYDEMSPRSFPTFPGGTSLQRWHRDLLRRAMESEGFAVNEEEWWHFDYKEWKHYPILNVPFEDLGKN